VGNLVHRRTLLISSIVSKNVRLTYLPDLHALLSGFRRSRCINLKAHDDIEI
jgi:hypothetical protein